MTFGIGEPAEVALRRLDLDDVGAEVGERPTGDRTGQHSREVEHQQAGRAVRAMLAIGVGHGGSAYEDVRRARLRSNSARRRVMANDHALAGRSALITGGGSGIGLGCAAAPAGDGASVTITGRSEDTLRAAAAELRPPHPTGAPCDGSTSDVADEATVSRRRGGGVRGDRRARHRRRIGRHRQRRTGHVVPVGGVAPGDRHEPHRRVPHDQARRRGHAARRGRIDHRHLVDRFAAARTRSWRRTA